MFVVVMCWPRAERVANCVQLVVALVVYGVMVWCWPVDGGSASCLWLGCLA